MTTTGNDPDLGKTVTAADWNDRYKSGDSPWDTSRPSPELVRVISAGTIRPGRAIELGCGTGTNAIYLAERGFHVTAIDISSVAIDRARQRAQTAGVRVDVFESDVTALSVREPFDFVFDRGCYHCVRRTNVAGYVAALDHLTHAGTRLLLLAGNANEQSDEGPPRVHERDIRADLGGMFDVEWVRTFRFENIDGSEGPLAWSAMLVRREA
ncbi:MAG: methyltransferase domain-containing protein [Planctomycetia bacterium]|nr:methyltransferase domain-containing protein [Planctomycetia bacterium]